MIVWLFHIADLFVLVTMVGTHLGLLDSWRALLGGAAYLLGKGWFYRGDFMSMIDMVLGIYLIMMLFGAAWTLTWIAVAWFLYKFIVAFVLR
ncbi:hypothetical protein CMO92_03120 [Candidatus Woesearchaeota archaeon]|mgnify:CR=1 FL=1|nr:hypothetical protein [Candidatus Woesearchaeota archaeon]|tara:strand:+ start:2053 stop:2328 length:276 start_codon:yes stop_codon:yes gene_type:complete